MATAQTQAKWRGKHRFIKRQLTVMARKQIHDDLDELAAHFHLRGKAEAVSFSAFLAKAMLQAADHNAEAARLLTLFAEAFQRDRDLYRP